MSGEASFIWASFEVIGKFVCEQNFKVGIIGVASAELGRRCFQCSIYKHECVCVRRYS